MDDSTFLNGKDHKDFKQNIGVCKWMIVAGIFDLSYAVSSLGRFSYGPLIGHIELAIRIFSYLNNHPKRGYVINPQTLTIDVDDEKVYMKYDSGNQYA